MRKVITALLVLCVTKVSAQTITYEWQPVIPGIVCHDSSYNECYINHLLNDTLHDILWMSGKFKGAHNLISPNIMGYDGTHFVKFPLANVQFDIQTMIIYHGKFVMVREYPHAGEYGVEEFNIDSGTVKQLGIIYGDHGPKCMAIYNGDLIIGGDFYAVRRTDTIDHDTYANNIVKWNGYDWTSLGSGMTGNHTSDVNALKVFNDKLFVGGSFDYAGGIDSWNIAEWNGANWSNTGCIGTWSSQDGLSNVGYVNDIEVSNGELYAGGHFDTICGKFSYIAKWNGVGWDTTHYPCNYISQLKSFKDGLVVLSPQFGCFPFIYYWEYFNITPIDTAFNLDPILETFHDDLYAGGGFAFSGNTQIFRLAKLKIDTIADTTSTNTITITDKSIRIFPNPASDEITIEILNGVSPDEIKIADVTGRVLKQLKPHQPTTFLNIKDLPPGIYFLQIKTNNGVEVRKLVKE